VRAIHAGVVAFADWFKGYGLLVVVDHGDGFYSLYAHLLELRVSRSTRVSGGSLVGLSGESGSLEGPRLYFEIRQGERPLDPRAWLALRRR
jgi:septal ring factor EnvC (AmiA/AmiB activator)